MVARQVEPKFAIVSDNNRTSRGTVKVSLGQRSRATVSQLLAEQEAPTRGET